MVDRRSFLSSNIALAVLVGWPLRGSAEMRTSLAAAAWPHEAALAIVDGQLDEAEAFAAQARRNGVRSLGFQGDVAGLWMRDLEPRLRAGPVAIAGYTSAATLFCLDLLARDYGARTLSRVAIDGGVSWILSSSPARRAPLTPSRWSHTHA